MKHQPESDRIKAAGDLPVVTLIKTLFHCQGLLTQFSGSLSPRRV